MFQPDHFNWTCVNMLFGAGDAYSTDVALAFEKVAKNVGIDVCNCLHKNLVQRAYECVCVLVFSRLHTVLKGSRG